MPAKKKKSTVIRRSSSHGEMSEDTKTLIVILLLIFVFPIGVIVMWFWVKWPTWVKVLVTVPCVLLLLAIIGMVAALSLVLSNPANYHSSSNVQYNSNYSTGQPTNNGNY